MNTATQLSTARTELELFQRKYGYIVSEYLKAGGTKSLLPNRLMPDAVQVEKIIRLYFEKVEAVSQLTRKINQEYLNTVNIEQHRPLYMPKRWQAA